MKFIALTTAAVLAGGPAAIAGPYVNVEANSGFSGADYLSTNIDYHVGYAGGASKVNYYVQAGPSQSVVDGGDSTTEFSGKTGLNIAAHEKFDIYGEISFATVDNADNNYGTKVGATYKF